MRSRSASRCRAWGGTAGVSEAAGTAPSGVKLPRHNREKVVDVGAALMRSMRRGSGAALTKEKLM
jgi:hypothetical protein